MLSFRKLQQKKYTIPLTAAARAGKDSVRDFIFLFLKIFYLGFHFWVLKIFFRIFFWEKIFWLFVFYLEKVL